MNKITVILLSLTLAIAFNSCKKDYPKDIPDWLKTKINEIKKDNPCNELPITIEEYEKYSSSTILYVFTKPCPMCNYEAYDYYGNIICNNIVVWGPNDSCGNILFSEYVKTRNIWTETCKN